MAKNKHKDSFENVIVGSGLPGLILTKLLEQSGQESVLLESGDLAGGSFRPATNPMWPTSYFFDVFPDTDAAKSALRFIGRVLNREIVFDVHDNTPVCYESGKFTAFVGMGDKKLTAASELASLTANPSLLLQPAVHEWIGQLIQELEDKDLIRFHSHLTSIEVDRNQVCALGINESQSIKCKKLIYCDNPAWLVPLLRNTPVAAKAIERLAKSQFWTSVGLNFLHAEVINPSTCIHVLSGGKEARFPAVGRFFPTDSTKQISQWQTLIALDEGDEAELLGNAVKFIKKQIKRCYPQALEQLKHEHIKIVPSSHGICQLKPKVNQSFPGIDNLLLASGLVHKQKNLLGQIQQTQLIASLLCPGFTVDTDSKVDENYA